MKISERGKVGISEKKEDNEVVFYLMYTSGVGTQEYKLGILVDQKLWCWVFFHRSAFELII